MGRQRNWEVGKKKKTKKKPVVPVNAKRTWEKSGGWRDFWKRERDRRQNPKFEALRGFDRRYAGAPEDWAKKLVAASGSLSELVVRLKGNSLFREMSSQGINNLMQAAVRYHGHKLALVFLCRELVYFLTGVCEIFEQETKKLAQHYAQNRAISEGGFSLPQLFNECQTVDDFDDRVDELRPDIEKVAQSLRPFLNQLADWHLGNRLIKELTAFAKPREEQIDDYVEL